MTIAGVDSHKAIPMGVNQCDLHIDCTNFRILDTSWRVGRTTLYVGKSSARSVERHSPKVLRIYKASIRDIYTNQGAHSATTGGVLLTFNAGKEYRCGLAKCRKRKSTIDLATLIRLILRVDQDKTWVEDHVMWFLYPGTHSAQSRLTRGRYPYSATTTTSWRIYSGCRWS